MDRMGSGESSRRQLEHYFGTRLSTQQSQPNMARGVMSRREMDEISLRMAQTMRGRNQLQRQGHVRSTDDQESIKKNQKKELGINKNAKGSRKRTNGNGRASEGSSAVSMGMFSRFQLHMKAISNQQVGLECHEEFLAYWIEPRSLFSAKTKWRLSCSRLEL